MNKFFFYFNEKIIFIKIPSILTSFIPFFLITGPFFPDLIVSLCALIFLINSIKNSLFSYYKSNFFIYVSRKNFIISIKIRAELSG